MRAALDKDLLIRVYNRISARYDLQHAFITAGADGRGRRLVVKHAVHKSATLFWISGHAYYLNADWEFHSGHLLCLC